jgi:tetratricopeptide (TPR) repeat protein
VATLVGTIVALLAWIVRGETIRDWLRPSLDVFPIADQVFNAIFGEPKPPEPYFISYLDLPGDRCMLEEITKQLKKLGYLPIPGPWGESDFEHEMASADQRTRHTLTILSRDYIRKLRGKPQWMQEFKVRNEPDSKKAVVHAAVVMTEWWKERPPDLTSIVVIDFATLNGSEVRRKLKARLPLDTKQGPVSPAGENKGATVKVSVINNVPQPNKFFFDRDDILADLYTQFSENERAHQMYPQALIGLSGMGTTETALNYAHRYIHHYQAVLWVNASGQDLASICREILTVLSVQVNESQDVEVLIRTVKDELKEYANWLLILDGCKHPEVVRDLKSRFSQGEKGDILLTTDRQDFAEVARAVPLKGLKPDEGALFLRHRTGKIDTDKDDPEIAREISVAMGGLPLGLELAGAYILGTGCSLQRCLELYRGQRSEILLKSQPRYSSNRKTIAAIWSLAFEELITSPNEYADVAAELLRFSAFLAYEEISEKKIIEAAHGDLGPLGRIVDPEVWGEAIKELGAYSLIHCSDSMVRIHPLVQAVIREGMMYDNEKVLKSSAERAAKTIYSVEVIKAACHHMQFTNWQSCQEHLPSLLACAEYIEKRHLESIEALRLLCLAGRYRLERAEYKRAEELLKSAMELHEKIQNGETPELGVCLNTVAEIYHMQGKYGEAKEHYQKALDIHKQNDSGKAIILNNLGWLYDDLGMCTEAESRYKQAFNIHKRQWKLNMEDPNLIANLIVTLSNIAWIYFKQSKFDDARKLYNEEALLIFREILGENHLWRHTKTRQYRDYELIYTGILDISKKTLGPNHLYTARGYANLATFYTTQGKYVEAERFYQEALEIGKHSLGNNHPQIAARFNNWAELCRVQSKFGKAEQNYKDAKKIYEKLTLEYPWLTYVLQNYATLLDAGHTDGTASEEANELRRRAKEIQAKYVRREAS